MTVRRALILGGTGMLAGCASNLVAEGWHVVLPSRHYAPIPAEVEESRRSRRAAGGVGTSERKALWVETNWSEPEVFAAKAAKALAGSADLLIAWVHDRDRVPVLRAVGPLLAPDAPVVEVLGSESARLGCPEPVLDGHRTQQVVLTRDGTRWLTHQAISAGVLAAVTRALQGRPSGVHQLTE